MCFRNIFLTGLLLLGGSSWGVTPPQDSDKQGVFCSSILAHVEEAKRIEEELRSVINRWRGSLNQPQLQQLVKFFASLFGRMSISERFELVNATLSGNEDAERLVHQIDYDGAADMFAVELVTKAQRFGILINGQQTTALWKILIYLALYPN